MKKNLIMSLIVAGAMGLMLTGCGDKPEKVTVEVQESIEATVETQPTETAQPTVEADAEDKPLADVETTQGVESQPTESTETTAEATTESATEVVEVEVPQQEVDYLAENGITITPCGEMTMTLARLNSDELVDTTVVTSIEVVPSDEEGYSDTIFTAKIDVASIDQNFNSTWHVYDRYTGYDLEGLAEELVLVSESGSATNTAIVEVDGKEYDCTVSVNADTTSDPAFWFVTYTVHHPSEYDGVVFEAGKLTATMQSVETTVDKSVVRKIADYPELIEGHYFFTATNN